MKMVRILVIVPESIKKKLDALRSQGYTASGYIRAVLERQLKGKESRGYGRQAARTTK